MDNVTHAIFLAFAMFALVLGLAYSMYLINSMNSVANTLIQTTDSTRDYQTVTYDSSKISPKGSTIGSGTTKRIVGIDTVISTIYGYNQESYAVEIYDKSKNLIQIFDLTVENIIASRDTTNNEYNAYNSLYNTEGKPCYLYGAPWIGNSEYLKLRLDMFVSGQTGYINGKKIEYSNNQFAKWVKINIEDKDKAVKFTEQFIQYTYDGDTISTNGEDIETITGSRRAQNKILIIYEEI